MLFTAWFSKLSGVAYRLFFLGPWNNQSPAKEKTICLARKPRNSNPFAKNPGIIDRLLTLKRTLLCKQKKNILV